MGAKPEGDRQKGVADGRPITVPGGRKAGTQWAADSEKNLHMDRFPAL